MGINRCYSGSAMSNITTERLGHVLQRHIARAYMAQRSTSLTALAGMLGAILIGAVTGSADAGMGARSTDAREPDAGGDAPGGGD